MKISDRAVGLIFILFLIVFTGPLSWAQSDLRAEATGTDGEASGDLLEIISLPQGYGEIELGMDLETVQALLKRNPNFSYRGEPDVSMRPLDKQELIDCEGVLFIDRAFFQFEDEKLFLIIIVMDQEYIDHYSIYTSFLEKYGEPSFLNPSKANWENEKVIISLERPLSLKYIDRKVLERLQSESAAESTMETVLREDFINSF